MTFNELNKKLSKYHCYGINYHERVAIFEKLKNHDNYPDPEIISIGNVTNGVLVTNQNVSNKILCIANDFAKTPIEDRHITTV